MLAYRAYINPNAANASKHIEIIRLYNRLLNIGEVWE